VCFASSIGGRNLAGAGWPIERPWTGIKVYLDPHREEENKFLVAFAKKAWRGRFGTAPIFLAALAILQGSRKKDYRSTRVIPFNERTGGANTANRFHQERIDGLGKGARRGVGSIAIEFHSGIT